MSRKSTGRSVKKTSSRKKAGQTSPSRFLKSVIAAALTSFGIATAWLHPQGLNWQSLEPFLASLGWPTAVQQDSAPVPAAIDGYVQTSFAQIEKLQQQKGMVTGVPTGFVDMDEMTRGAAVETVRPQVVKVALEHHLVSAYTSMVAVDVTATAPAGDPKVAMVRASLPNGWSAGTMLPQTDTPALLHLLIALGMLIAAALLARTALRTGCAA